MKLSEMESDLYCIHCRTETPHVITYLNDEIKKIGCKECQNAVGLEIDIMQELYKEFYNRISTKPNRISQEYREDLSHFLARLPIRVVSKPYRLIKELQESRKIIRRYKKSSIQ
ncbi:bh protein [Brevibacillus fulvus]|uniref:Bh protein n=1 Tax=Brevibacillus fulvus TaxID=1125967 RepID=A0A938XWW4_9BACL|nr:bh protein [Brevibacillus fulvus]MBM7591682.1 hypothetical protein [Brevibacillus fulvus]